MAVNNSDIEIIFKTLAILLVDSLKALGLLYFIDFISLSNKSFKSLTCVGKVQCCLESILFQRFDIYFCFPNLNVHPSCMNPLETVWCNILFHVRSYLQAFYGKGKTMNTYFVRKSGRQSGLGRDI